MVIKEEKNIKKTIVFFDIDNTLYDYDYSHEAGLKAAYNVWKRQTDDSFEQFKEKYGVARNWVKRFLVGRAAVHSRALYFQKMTELFISNPDIDMIIELHDDYWNAALNNMNPYPGIYDVIKELKGKGYRLGVITNMTAALQYQKLSKLKLNDYFDRIISSEEVGHEKPHPLIFSHALNVFDVAAKDTWMVGDSFIDDIETAAWLGMNAVWFNPTKKTPTNNVSKVKYHEIESMTKLVPLIEERTKVKPEGVIKYSLEFNKKEKSVFDDQDIVTLRNLRNLAHKNNLIGVYPLDHPELPNIGFGNISQRWTKDGQFMITASQTGHLDDLTADQFSLVTDFLIDNNKLYAKGRNPPSSEALTHAAIYDIAPDIKFILHIHHPKLWAYAKNARFPSTPENVPYGTPQMGRAVQKVYTDLKITNQLVVMHGHKDGVIIWGENGEQILNECLKVIEELKHN